MALVFVVVKVIRWMIVTRIWRARIRSAGYNPDMFILQTDRPKDKIHPPQYIAAMKIFFAMYCAPADARKALVHLAAEMQAGKTGVCDALIRIIRRNVEDKHMAPNVYKNIFVVTGLSDKAWVRQTRKRLPDVNIHHNNTLAEMQTKLRAIGEKGLRNVLIIVDESHVASAKSNRPEKCIYSELRAYLPNVADWAARNVHLLTVSATDPAIVLMIAEKERVVYGAVVGLETSKHYQSVQQLREADRIRDVGNIGPETVGELRRAVESYDTPRYHILRTEKSRDTVELLEREFPGTAVLKWDANNKQVPGDAASSTSDDNDINDMLEKPPAVTTFIVIKRMFSCAKTMTDTHVGVLWDYVSKWEDKDSVRLQSLLGRACGYGRSQDTVVYTSMRVVDDYLNRWRDALRSVESMRELKDAVPSQSSYTGVKVKDGKLKRVARHAAPVDSGEEPEEPEEPGQVIAYAHNAAGGPQEFPTLATAQEWSVENLWKKAVPFRPCDRDGGKTAQTHFPIRRTKREIRSVADTLGSGDLAYGQGKLKADGTRTGSPRAMPVMTADGLRWIVLYAPHWLKPRDE